jgi:hypothetical protein
MKIKEEKSECVSVHVRIRPFTDKEPQDSSIEILDSTTNAMRSMFNIITFIYHTHNIYIYIYVIMNINS